MIRFNKYFPFVFLYFFLNSWGLPFGLTFTTLLAPFFYVWILITRKRELLLPFLAVLAPYLILHLTLAEPETRSYFISLINLTGVYIFCQAAYTFLTRCRNIDKIFRQILIINFIFCLAAIPLFFTPYAALLWDEQVLTGGVGRYVRLRLLTYEPSYYALLFIPFFFYFLLQYFFRQNTMHAGLLLPMILLPMVLSFSIGVIAAAMLAVFITWVSHFRRLTARKRIANALINGGVTFCSAVLVLILFFRQNPIFTRLRNIFTGEDSSGKGRTVDAFLLANRLLGDNHEFWGIGLGQIKIAGDEIIKNYYLYNMDLVVTIPNAAAETLAIFGWPGLILRISVELVLLLLTRVWTNYYRLLLFLFIFIYQFSGSFITNGAEYIIWILAFTNVFPKFQVKREMEHATF